MESTLLRDLIYERFTKKQIIEIIDSSGTEEFCVTSGLKFKLKGCRITKNLYIKIWDNDNLIEDRCMNLFVDLGISKYFGRT